MIRTYKVTLCHPLVWDMGIHTFTVADKDDQTTVESPRFGRQTYGPSRDAQQDEETIRQFLSRFACGVRKCEAVTPAGTT
jgi:hypothetical protein